ncbi:MAG: hypothetical protein HY369_04000 [Candidatus Aenigmarchaeota archaeon]|nr:hypothetical protein [Candidatus Aenigmarchaeota archaeon]
MEHEVKEWMGKLEQVKKGTFDLSKDEDLSIALMNLVSLEEHFFFTAMKTEKPAYLDMLNGVRTLRKTLLQKIVTNPAGEEWCISKHLLAASMRLLEVGTKELSQGSRKEAERLFTASFHLYSLFFAINLKIAGDPPGPAKPADRSPGNPSLSRFSAIVKKLVDCCKE